MGRDRYDDERRYADRVALALGVGILLVLVLSLLCGCSRKVYLPVERVVMRTDTLRENALRVDSVILRDSVAVMQRGDTVYYTRWRDRVRVREVTDTVYKAVTDSVRCEVPYPVERELTKWERVKMDFGGMAMWVVIIAVCVAVIWLVILKTRKD